MRCAQPWKTISDFGPSDLAPILTMGLSDVIGFLRSSALPKKKHPMRGRPRRIDRSTLRPRTSSSFLVPRPRPLPRLLAARLFKGLKPVKMRHFLRAINIQLVPKLHAI